MSQDSAIFCDLYQLTMMQGYFRKGIHNDKAVFDLFYRKPPYGWPFIIACGVQDAVEYVEQLKFTDKDISYLKSLDMFSDEFLEYLRNFKFTGDIYGVHDGEVVPPTVPILTVRGPLAECQLIETALLNKINFQSLIATKSARICHSAGKHGVVDFGLRRAQGDAGLDASKACFVGGCVGTSNVLAGKTYGIPVNGTQAHAWVQSFDSELESFRAYAETFPDKCVLLIDTYDTLMSGLPNALTVARELREKGKELLGVRLDSGDLAQLGNVVFTELAKNGFGDATIVMSDDLDENKIHEIVSYIKPIRIPSYSELGEYKVVYPKLMFGVGTKMVTGSPNPALGGVYKLVELNGSPKMKLSSDYFKMTTPSWKVPFRIFDEEGKIKEDILVDYNDSGAFEKSLSELDIPYKSLHTKIMEGGEVILTKVGLKYMRDRRETTLNYVPDLMKQLDFLDVWDRPGIPVKLDTRLRLVKEALMNQLEVK